MLTDNYLLKLGSFLYHSMRYIKFFTTFTCVTFEPFSILINAVAEFPILYTPKNSRFYFRYRSDNTQTIQDDDYIYLSFSVDAARYTAECAEGPGSAMFVKESCH